MADGTRVADNVMASLRQCDGGLSCLPRCELIAVEFDAIVKRQNLEVSAFINVVNARNSAEKIGLDESLVEALKKSEASLAAKVAALFDRDVEELYEEGDE